MFNKLFNFLVKAASAFLKALPVILTVIVIMITKFVSVSYDFFVLEYVVDEYCNDMDYYNHIIKCIHLVISNITSIKSRHFIS